MTTYKYYSDDDFVSGDSPVTLEIRVDLDPGESQSIIWNDGPGSFTYAASSDEGSTFGEEVTIGANESHSYGSGFIDELRITHSGDDSSYRVLVLAQSGVILTSMTDPTRPNFGTGQTPDQNTSVGTTSVQILAANVDRVGLSISNYSGKDVWLAWNVAAESEKGIWLDKDSTAFFDEGFISQGVLNAITKTGTAKLAWQEMNK